MVTCDFFTIYIKYSDFVLFMQTYILSLGGSLIAPDRIDIEFLKGFRNLILESLTKGNRFIIVCGGGMVCRNYQNAAKEINDVNRQNLDWIGIMSTRLNAELVRGIFSENAYEKVAGDPEEFIDTDKMIIIGAGYLPGHSSDMDAVLLAKTYGAQKLVNMSNIDKVYTEDPKKNPDAEPIDTINWEGFQKIVGEEFVPGNNYPFDPIASKKSKEFGLEVAILNGKNLENLKKYLEDKEFIGTKIHP